MDVPGPEDDVPLVVDLDGTLLRGDTLHELIFSNAFRSPSRLPSAFLALLRGGKAAFKSALSQRHAESAAALPAREEVLALIRERKALGRRIVLATGAHRLVADAAARRFGLFDEVLATGDADVNLIGFRKRDELVRRYGDRGYDYVGDSTADVPVWESARQAWSAGRAARRHLVAGGREVRPLVPVEKDSPAWKSLRVHQWVKNLLLFLPVLAGHRFLEAGPVLSSVLGFAAFSLAASLVYVVNDLADRESDRAHSRKRRRPIAWGSLGPLHATAVGFALASGLVAICFALPWQVGAGIATYFAVNILYSFHFKRRILVDVFMLAWMYVWRVVVGGWASGIQLTPWLLGFSGFTFLSLAFAKRYAEVVRLGEGRSKAMGRAWRSDDAPALLASGIASGVAGAVVLALYVSSDSFSKLYRNPTIAMLLAPLFLYWVIRLWIQAGRLELHEDPVVFAVKDRISYAVVAAGIAILSLAMLWR